MPISHVSFQIKLYTSEPLDDGRCPLVVQISWRDRKPQVRRKRLSIACYPDEFDTNISRLRDTVWSHRKLNKELEESLQKGRKLISETLRRSKLEFDFNW